MCWKAIFTREHSAWSEASNRIRTPKGFQPQQNIAHSIQNPKIHAVSVMPESRATRLLPNNRNSDLRCFRRVLCCHLQAGADLILFVDASHLAKLTNQEAPCEGAVKPAGSRNRPSCGEQGEAVRSVGLPGAEFRLHLPVRAATLLLGLNNAEPYHERDPRLRQNGERGERLPATSSCSCPSRKTCRQGEAGPQTLHCSPAACTDASAIPHSVI